MKLQFRKNFWGRKWQRLGLATLGILVGAGTLYLALRGIRLEDMRGVLAQFDPLVGAAAVAVYFSTIVFRSLRWWLLLSQLAPLSRRSVAEATIVGYAANYLLPARLGELFRADYIKRISSVSRSASIGSIGVERLLDGLTILALLAIGTLLLETAAPMGEDLIHSIIIAASLIFGGLAVFLATIRLAHPWIANRPGRLFQIASAFVEGIRSLNAWTALPVLALTSVIWMLELSVLYLMLRAFGQTLAIGPLTVLEACLALSTLAPTAPGFLGSLQFVAALLMESFGYGRALGVATVTAMQLFCYLPLAMLGCVIGIMRWRKHLHRRD